MPIPEPRFRVEERLETPVLAVVSFSARRFSLLA
jgi:hypothetical protein